MLQIGVLCGDKWHPAEVIQQGFEPLQKEGILPEFFPDRAPWSLERMQQYPVLVVCKASSKISDEDHGWLTSDIQQNFRDFVTLGGGLLVCHSGTVGYRDHPDFRALTGGVFVSHPPQCPVTLDYTSEYGHATNDPKTILIHDEHYFVETADDLQIFLHSTSEHGTQPAGWTRQEGKGRVCVLTPGHFADVWTHPVYQQTLRKMLHWCAQTEEVL